MIFLVYTLIHISGRTSAVKHVYKSFNHAASHMTTYEFLTIQACDGTAVVDAQPSQWAQRGSKPG
jgi:hypothetical protein